MKFEMKFSFFCDEAGGNLALLARKNLSENGKTAKFNGETYVKSRQNDVK